MKNRSAFARDAFSALETAFLLIAPLFIIAGVRKYIPLPVFVIFGLWFFVLLFYFRSRQKSSGDFLSAYLFSTAVLTFIVAVWNIYDIGTLLYYPDTGVYMKQSEFGLLNGKFWSMKGGRPFVTPLIFKAFQRDLASINDFFIIIYLAATLFFIFVLTRFFPGAREKMAAGYVFLLLFLNQNSISLWLSCALSEIPSIVMTLLLFSVFGLLYIHREALNKRSRRSYAAIGAITLVAVLFATSRDSNVYFLPCLLPFFFLVFKRWKFRIILSLLIVLVFGAAKISADKTRRWERPLQNVMQWRVLPDDRLRQTFQNRYHLPKDKLVMPLAKNWHPRPRKIKRPLITWIRKHGAVSYRNFLITHPQYVLQEWRKEWDVIQKGMWILENEPEYYADPKVRPKRLNAAIFNFPGHVSFPLAILVAAFGLILIKKNPLLFFASAHSFIVGLIAFHADYVEVSRHCQQASMTLKIAYLLSILSLYVAIKNGLLGKPAQPREISGSVNKAAPEKMETIEK